MLGERRRWLRQQYLGYLSLARLHVGRPNDSNVAETVSSRVCRERPDTLHRSRRDWTRLGGRDRRERPYYPAPHT